LIVHGLFADYDGTLAPAEVDREKSRLPSVIEAGLREIASRIPLAVITSKDFEFIHPRTRFADAWACAGGLEIRLSNGKTFATRKLRDLTVGLSYVYKMIGERFYIERKLGKSGRLLVFSIDWRRGQEISRDLLGAILNKLSQEGLCVSYNASYPFVDVFAAKPDKGRALNKLKKMLGIKGEVMFIGDSAADNPAFDKADVSLCVSHGQPLDEVRSEFVVDYDKLDLFLSSLARNELDFSPSLPHIRSK